MPRQKFVKPRGGMIGNPAEHVDEPSPRLDVVELGRGDELPIGRAKPLTGPELSERDSNT